MSTPSPEAILASLTKTQRAYLRHAEIWPRGGSQRKCAYNLRDLGLFTEGDSHYSPLTRTPLGDAVAALLPKEDPSDA